MGLQTSEWEVPVQRLGLKSRRHEEDWLRLDLSRITLLISIKLMNSLCYVHSSAPSGASARRIESVVQATARLKAMKWFCKSCSREGSRLEYAA